MMIRTALAVAFAVGLGFLPVLHAQARRPPIAVGKPKVDLVDVVGCVERTAGVAGAWWLRNAATPKVTTVGFVTATDVESAKSLPLGANSFELIGVTDFLDPDALLQDPDRSKFVKPESANATGQLRPGRKVLVKGLILEADGQKRINLTQVIGLADACGT
jgi:hypothetical protein